jgi:hypothetical protein
MVQELAHDNLPLPEDSVIHQEESLVVEKISNGLWELIMDS